MSANPAALTRLVREFLAAEPLGENSGIYAGKGGYHNTRRHHLAGTYGGSPSDYSVQEAADKAGSADYAAAVDLSLSDARLHGDYRTIARYCKRLYDAMQAQDGRFYHEGDLVVREFFGNIDLDSTVEGWSIFRNRAMTSDASHRWHIHLSFFRRYADNWDAVSGTLDVLLARHPLAPFPGAAYFRSGEQTDLIGRMNTRLRQLGYAAPNTRTFDSASRGAVIAWQRHLGYSGSDADGIPGASSWKALKVAVDTPLPAIVTKPNPAPRPVPVLEGDMKLTDTVKVPAWALEQWPDDKGLQDGEISLATAIGSGYFHSRLAQERTAELEAQVAELRAEVDALRTPAK